MTNWNPTPGVRDVSVAVLYPGTRVDKMLVPLETTSMTVDVEPPNAYEYDIVVADNADRDLGKEAIKNKLTDSLLVYRMRGDLYRELELWDMPWYKKWAALQVVKQTDGVISVTDFLAQKAERKSGVQPVGQAGMWIHEDEYPMVEHTDIELRAVTLTNANYERKVLPILKWAPAVEQLLDEIGGHWYVFGKGEQGEKLRLGLLDYKHVHFMGYTNEPKTELGNANAMFHPSNLDGQPNAVLEGLASGLPVVTTDFIAFEEWAGDGAPLNRVRNTSELETSLRQLRDPNNRSMVAANGIQYVKKNHTPETIGVQYEEYFTRLLEAKA